MKYPDAVAVPSGGQWASLAPQYDIASCGDTADEALDMVQAAVHQVLELCAEESRPVPGPISWADFGEFVSYADVGAMVIRLTLP